MSTVYSLIGGGFANMTASFAVHPLDRQQAADYLAAAVKADISWNDAEADIRAYLASQGCTASFIQDEVARAKPMLAPWLR